jgi:hypothetical protein
LSGYWRSTGSRGEGEQGSRGCLSSGYPFSLIHQRIFFGKFKLIRAKLNKTSQKLHKNFTKTSRKTIDEKMSRPLN